MAEDYYYSSSAPKMTLVGTLGGSATTMQVDTVAGLPGSVPFKLVIDPGLTTEEIVKVTAVSGTTLTLVRGWDGSPSRDHANLAEIRHMVTAEDLRLSRQHESKTTAHGVTGDIVGTLSTQTIANKDLSSATNIFPSTLASKQNVTDSVNLHAITTSTHGAVGALVGVNNTQTLTNKTISGASNTFQSIPQSAVTNLTTDQSTQDSRLTNVEGRASSLETRATNIETKNSTQDTNITNLTTRVTALEADTGWVSSVSGLTAAAGFSITGFVVRKKDDLVAVQINCTRTGAALSAGNIANVNVVNLPAAWTPAQSNGALQGGPSGGSHACYASSGGAIVMTYTTSGFATGAAFNIMGTYLL